MFEHDQETVGTLLSKSPEFRSLYNRHALLKQQVKDAEDGTTVVDHNHLGEMKKEKLHAKDKMAAIMAQYQREPKTQSSAVWPRLTDQWER